MSQSITIKTVEAPAFKDLSAMLTPRFKLVVEYRCEERLLGSCCPPRYPLSPRTPVIAKRTARTVFSFRNKILFPTGVPGDYGGQGQRGKTVVESLSDCGISSESPAKKTSPLSLWLSSPLSLWLSSLRERVFFPANLQIAVVSLLRKPLPVCTRRNKLPNRAADACA